MRAKSITRILLTMIIIIAANFNIAYGAHIVLHSLTIDAVEPGLMIESIEGTFVSKSAIMPGDDIERSYEIMNHYDKPYSLSVNAENPVSSPSALKEIMDLTITFQGREIYHGNLTGIKDSEDHDMASGLDLGIINPGERKELKAKFVFPGKKMNNDYIHGHAEVNWVLKAKISPDAQSATDIPDGEGTNKDNNDQDDKDITPSDIKKADVKKADIEKADIKRANIKMTNIKTEDVMNLMFFTVILLAVVMVIMGLIKIKHKNRDT